MCTKAWPLWRRSDQFSNYINSTVERLQAAKSTSKYVRSDSISMLIACGGTKWNRFLEPRRQPISQGKKKINISDKKSSISGIMTCTQKESIYVLSFLLSNLIKMREQSKQKIIKTIQVTHIDLFYFGCHCIFHIRNRRTIFLLP